MGKDNYEETICCLALGRIFGFEPRIGISLIDGTGSAAEVFRMDRAELDERMGPYNRFSSEINRNALEEAGRIYESLGNCGFIGCTDEVFPELLRDCGDSPLGLYYRSSTPIEKVLGRSNPYISIVGTRDLSPYGAEWCRRIVDSMAASGSKPTIVSGLAYGVDITAHLEALKNGLPTIAVMATGIDSIYPWRHQRYAEEIAAAPGSALITDYPPGTEAAKINFLRRNRIIAGLSSATILVESKIKGGGMVTADLASSYGREVYALPGRIDDLRSGGCNRLISAKVAEAISSEEFLMKSLGLGSGRGNRRVDDILERINETYSKDTDMEKCSRITEIAAYIKSHRGVLIEDIAAGLGIEYRECMALCAMLESDGFVAIDLLQRCTLTR